MRESLSPRLRFEILRRCNFACYYCGVPAALGVKQLHIDHVIPVSLGGTNDPWNLVSACWDCNTGKTNGPPSEDLLRRVRGDYCAYINALGTPVGACRYCGIPIVPEDGETPPGDDEDCYTCNQVFFAGVDYANGRTPPEVVA